MTALLIAVSATAQSAVSLDSCRRMAIRNNKEIIKAQTEIEKAGYQRRQAEAAYLPNIDFEAGYVYNQKKISLVEEDQYLPTKSFNPATGTYDFNIVTDPTGMPVMNGDSYIFSPVAMLPKSALTYNIHNLMAAAVTVTQPVYMGGKIRAMNEITRYTEQLAQSMHDAKVEDVVYSVDEAYWQVVSLGAKKTLCESYLTLVENLDSDVVKMMRQGVATRANQLTVDVRVNEASVALTKVENGLTLSRMLLAQRCGLPVNSNLVLEDENRSQLTNYLHPTIFDMDSVYAHRNDIQALTIAGKIYDQKVKVAQSEMLPQVAAFGAYHATNPNTYNGFKNKFGVGFAIGAMVKIPIWHWGGLSNKVKEAQAEARIKQIELDDAKEKIELQVQQAAFKYQEAWKTYEKTRANLVKADENLRCAQIGFKEGVSNLDELLAAQSAWFLANSENIDAQIDIQLCDVYLSKVLGTMDLK